MPARHPGTPANTSKTTSAERPASFRLRCRGIADPARRGLRPRPRGFTGSCMGAAKWFTPHVKASIVGKRRDALEQDGVPLRYKIGKRRVHEVGGAALSRTAFKS